MLIAVATTTGLSASAFKTTATNATSNANVVLRLAPAGQIDQLARAKYQTDQAAKQAAEMATKANTTTKSTAKATQPVQTAKRTNTTQTVAKTTTAKPKPVAKKPECDRLIISKINLDSCLATVGLTADNKVGVHSSLPAWFNQSSRAGTNTGYYGATFIDGHRSGIFRNLGKLAVGDKVKVALMNGQSYTYTVRATETVALAKVDMQKALSIYGGAERGLNLMTCDGAYNTNIGTAERRLTVYTTL
ncbi:MAG: class F sortase [Candidatus Nomurabacteria bacterium]|jgi:LPXTG-site transpeptidase (sortase) family protein|nr:class F sortase [Candidatus Nomurabacteria bacterium]